MLLELRAEGEDQGEAGVEVQVHLPGYSSTLEEPMAAEGAAGAAQDSTAPVTSWTWDQKPRQTAASMAV